MKLFEKYLVLFFVGGLLYALIELLWRGYTHPAMILVGGLCFVACGAINEVIPWNMPLVKQGIIGALAITAVELVSGLILNVILGLGIWDYSQLPFNFIGQICFIFSCFWYFLSIAAIILDDYLRYWWFGEDKPHYTILKGDKR